MYKFKITAAYLVCFMALGLAGCGGGSGGSAQGVTVTTTAEPTTVPEDTTPPSTTVPTTPPPSTTPSALPLLQQSDLVYEGAIKVPKGKYGASTFDSSFSYGGAGLSYNATNNTLYIIGHVYENMIAELSIPAVVNNSDLASLNTASVVQGSIDIANGNWDNLKLDGSEVGNGGRPGSFIVYGGKLIGNSWAYFDGAQEAVRSHFTASLNWSTEGTQFSGMYRVGVHYSGSTSAANGGFVGGYMGHIPANRQAEFGGPVLTGLGGVSIISRSSYGPGAWVFNPADLGVTDPAPATMLLGYTADNQTLGSYSGPSLYYNGTTEVRGVVFPEGTDSVLFFGKHGLGMTGQGDSCYGVGTNNITLHSQPVGDGSIYCYDPVNSAKAPHAYPYVYRIWAYNAQDLLKVKNGVINPATGVSYKPWDITPYAIWNLDLPFANGDGTILGAAYDSSTQRIFISQQGGERYGEAPFPVIHVFKIALN
jgi:hypothetical protein